jgi:hypothetical protein
MLFYLAGKCVNDYSELAMIFLKACNGLSDWKLIDQQKKLKIKTESW